MEVVKNELWKSLKRLIFPSPRLAAIQKEHRETRGKEIDSSNTKMTFGEAVGLHLQHVNEDVKLKRRTRAYWSEADRALPKSWVGLVETEVRRVTSTA